MKGGHELKSAFYVVQADCVREADHGNSLETTADSPTYFCKPEYKLLWGW